MRKSATLYRVDEYSTNGRKIRTLHKDVPGNELRKLKFRTNINTKRLFKIYKTRDSSGNKVTNSLYRTVNLADPNKIVHEALNNVDLYYLTEIDYWTDRNCSRYGCDYICRCGEIRDPRIEYVDVEGVINILSKTVMRSLKQFDLNTDEQIIRYCLNRYFRFCGLDNNDNYDIDVTSGYYGEEIQGVWLYFWENTIDDIMEIVKSYGIDAVKFVLKKEYGFLTKFVDKAEELYIVTTIPDSLIAPNEEYCQKLSRDIIERYKNEYDFGKLPVGIFREDSNGYRIIDGYHRYHALMEQNVDECCILVMA